MEPLHIIKVNDKVDLNIVYAGIGDADCNIIEHIFSKVMVEKKLAIENYDEIKSTFVGANMVFILVNLSEVYNIPKKTNHLIQHSCLKR